MSRSVNKVIFIGNVVQDPEIVQVSQDAEVAKFTIAINEYYKKATGEEIQLTTYIDCESWGGLVKVIKDYVKKGSRIYIEGSLRSDKWTDADTGKSRTKHKIRVQDIVLLDSKRFDGASTFNSETDLDSSYNDLNIKEDDELPF